MIRRIALAVVLSIVVVGSAACSSDVSQVTGSADTQPVRVEMLIQDVLPQVGESFEEGQVVRAKDTGATVGEIVSIERVPAATSVPTSEGELRAAQSPLSEDVYLTIEGDSLVSDAGYSFGGTYLYVNNEIKYLTPYTLFNGIITSIEPMEP